MQGEFFINLIGLNGIIEELDEVQLVMREHKDRLESIKGSLHSTNFEASKMDLQRMEEKQSEYIKMMVSLKNTLTEIKNCYEQTEQKNINQLKADSNTEKQEGTSNTLLSQIGGSMEQDLLGTVLESSGNTVVKLSGYININTAIVSNPGNNGFIIVNPEVAGTTFNMAKWGTNFSKYGVPIIGGIIDYTGQKNSGEETGHAIIKTVVHTGTGMIVGGFVSAKVGAATGAAIGSIVPGAGTAVGAIGGTVVGFVAGSVTTFAVNMGFDSVYDNYLKEPINEACDTVKKKAGEVVDAIGNTMDDIGEAVSGVFSDLGSVFA